MAEAGSGWHDGFRPFNFNIIGLACDTTCHDIRFGKSTHPGGSFFLVRVVIGAASILFALGSVALWWLILARRVTSEDIRGMAEE